MKNLKEYTKPELVVVEIECLSEMLAASNLRYNDENADKDLELLSGKRRGSWGNLWE